MKVTSLKLDFDSNCKIFETANKVINGIFSTIYKSDNQ